MYYTPKTLLNHFFEDLRKTKAANNLLNIIYPTHSYVTPEILFYDLEDFF
jgi:hypothetical protein